MEQWKEIPGYPDYEASTAGRVRSITRKVPCRGGLRTAYGRVLKCFTAGASGYMQVDIASQRHSVHRLVAATWCPGVFDGAWVDHLNGRRDDNRAENLQWVTPSENATRPYEAGRRTGTCVGRMSDDHPTSKPVIATCVTTGVEREFASAMDAVREGFDSSCISRCCNGSSKTHKGYRWRFGAKHGVVFSEPEQVAA